MKFDSDDIVAVMVLGAVWWFLVAGDPDILDKLIAYVLRQFN